MKWTPASEHREYYHNNPYERGDWDMNEYEEEVQERLESQLDEMLGEDYLDMCSGGMEYELLCITLKNIAIAYNNGSDKDILLFSKTLAKAMCDSVQDDIERNM